VLCCIAWRGPLLCLLLCFRSIVVSPCISLVGPQKPQAEFQRDGSKGLSRAGAPLRRGDAFFCEDFRSLSGRRHVLSGPAALPRLLEAGGKGGAVTVVVPLEGCQARPRSPPRYSLDPAI
jgi:hypothetical protein